VGAEKNTVIKYISVLVVFIGLLMSPAILKPDDKEISVTGEYGFKLIDVREQAGITFVHESPRLDNKISHILPQIASVGASVSVCDFNNDGWNDLYFTNSKINSQNELYLNKRDGSFSNIADSLEIGDINKEGTGASMGSVWGDFDNDGFEDLFVYKWGKPELFRNIDGKGFLNVTDKSGLPEWVNSNTAVWLDFDADGLLDLFIGGYYTEEIDLWDLKTTRFMPESYEYANNGGRNYLMKNQGNGTFKDVTIERGMTSTKWTLAAGAVDINGDGFIELIIANDYSIDEFYLNAGGKMFVEVGKEVGIGFTPKSGMNISFGDIDNAGEIGLYVTNITEPGVLLQGNNYWSLQSTKSGMAYKNVARKRNIESGGWSYGTQFGDFNNDGHQDLYVANGFISGEEETSYWYDYSKVSGGNNAIISEAMNWPPMDGKSQSGYQQNVVWVNKGNGTFQDVSRSVCAPVTLDSRAVVVADLWNRGVLDVIVANQNAAPLIYKNENVEANHWIDFELTGRKSNRSAIGSKVELYWNDHKQVQILTGGIGFSGQNQHRVHFGIGESAEIDKVVIYWPSGESQEISNPAIDKIHEVIEGEKAI
jgi:hypothetical protein